jgi:hypothetical protein
MMNKLTLRKTYRTEPQLHPIKWCTIDLVFTVDGVERFRDSLTVNADFLEAVIQAPHHPFVPRVAAAVGIPRWELRGILYDLRDFAEHELTGTP